jgi:hypothetical protein
VLIAMLMLSLPQCRQSDVLPPLDAPTKPDPGSPSNAKPDAAEQARLDQLKKDFGQALARALAQEPGLRRLIKAEAVKQFNHEPNWYCSIHWCSASNQGVFGWKFCH